MVFFVFLVSGRLLGDLRKRTEESSDNQKNQKNHRFLHVFGSERPEKLKKPLVLVCFRWENLRKANIFIKINVEKRKLIFLLKIN